MRACCVHRIARKRGIAYPGHVCVCKVEGDMYVVSITISLIVFLLVDRPQFAVGKWTFSLRISVDSPTCGQMGTCDDLFMGLCLRAPGTTQLDGHNCPFFIAGNITTLLGREITSEDQVDAALMPDGVPYITTSYEGGIQLYLALLTGPDIPPFDLDEIIVDEWFVELERVADGGESSVVNATGVKENAVVSVCLHVDCYEPYSGDDCSCGEGMNCGVLPSSISISESPTSTQGSTSTSLAVPVSAAGGGLILLLLILIALVVLCLVYRRRRDRKSHRLDLNHLDEDLHLKELPPTIPPSDFVDDGVTYSAVVHNNESNGYPNSGHGDGFEVEETKDEQPGEGLVYADLDHSTNSPPSTKSGLMYAEVDHEAPTVTTFMKFSPRKRKPPMSSSSLMTPEAASEYSTIKQQQPHKYVNVPRPKPRNKKPQVDQNHCSTVPAGI